MLTLLPDRPPNPNGSALHLMPGGRYVEQWFEKEGLKIARRFVPAGVTSFVLRYRLPAERGADPEEAPLQDTQRAVRLRVSRRFLSPRASKRDPFVSIEGVGQLTMIAATKGSATLPDIQLGICGKLAAAQVSLRSDAVCRQ